jgi:CheY-like chemotaxis protein
MNNLDATPQPEASRSDQTSLGDLASRQDSVTSSGAISHSERRRKRRVLISAPVRLRSADDAGSSCDEISNTIDVSRNGILVLTQNQTLYRGMSVAVAFPYTKSPGVVHAEQPGIVVRVSATPEGQIAAAIAFGTVFAERQTGHPNAPKAALETPAKRFSTSSDPQKTLVLLVESEFAIRDNTKTFLTAQGYQVIAVSEASDAREVLNLFTPALLIAEIEGEGLPGFDLCAHVKATPRLRHIPVMLTTRSAYPSDYSSAHSLGAVVCMAKPYRQERLGHVVSLLAPHPRVKENAEPPRPGDPSRRPRRNTHNRSHPRLRFS